MNIYTQKYSWSWILKGGKSNDHEQGDIIPMNREYITSMNTHSFNGHEKSLKGQIFSWVSFQYVMTTSFKVHGHYNYHASSYIFFKAIINSLKSRNIYGNELKTKNYTYCNYTMTQV